MSKTISASRAAEVNEQMKRVAPELDSSYATYPLSIQSGQKLWVDPAKGKTSKGEPVFIKGDGRPTATTQVKPDYVYGAGPLGFGWYHLLTRDSYNALYRRLQSTQPSMCCAFSKAARRQVSDHEEVTKICYNRSVASVPDDLQAAKDAMDIARGTAKAVYNFTQNEQLVVNAVQTGAFIRNG